jgi:hypothetical protein
VRAFSPVAVALLGQATRPEESSGKKKKMDARLLMSGMTEESVWEGFI